VDAKVVSDPAAHTIAVVSLGVLGVAEWRLQWRTRGALRATSDRGTIWLFAIGLCAAAVLAIRAPDIAPGLSISNGAWWPFVAGLAVYWAGVALRWWGVMTLGSYFKLTVVVEPDHQVVDWGPYRVIRHPGYSGAMLIFLGLGLALDNWLSVAAAVLVIPGMLVRIRVEEAELTKALGERYRSYMRRTWRLIPRVW
jgi:protein-S-isoprenylcysteine O-methyltransferase Ste14